MADVQTENGYTRIANELMEVISKQKFNGTQFRILLVIIRYTYGFKRKHHDISLSFISKATDIHKQQVKKELDKLIEEKVISVVENSTFSQSRKLGINKDYSQWFNSQSVNKQTVSENAYTTVSELTDTTVSEFAYQEINNKENYKKNSVNEIFEHYISKNIVNHKKITSSMKTKINARLKDYTIEELIKAIDNYSTVFKSDEYWFTHKYPLADFMRDKDVSKFLDEADPLYNFAKNKKQKPKQQEYNHEEVDSKELLKLFGGG